MDKRIGTHKRWIGLVRAHQASGLKVEEFCRREKIYSTSFYGWRKRLGMAKEPVSHTLLAEYKGKGEVVRSLTKGFIRLMPPAVELKTIRLETANGYKVDTGHDGVDGLKDVLQVLQAL